MRRFIPTILVGLLVLGALLAAWQRASAQEKTAQEIFARLHNTLEERESCFIQNYLFKGPVYFVVIPSPEQRTAAVPSEHLVVLHQGLVEYVWSCGPHWQDVLAGLLARRLIELHLQDAMKVADTLGSLLVWSIAAGDSIAQRILRPLKDLFVENEKERLMDMLGARLACLAGYDPQALASYFSTHAAEYRKEHESEPFYFAPGGGEPYNPYAEQAKRIREEAANCPYWRRCEECR